MGGWETEIILISLGFLECLTEESVLYSMSSRIEELFPRALEEGVTHAELYCRQSL